MPLEGESGVQLNSLLFAPVGQRVITLRRFRGSCNSALHPGRVAPQSAHRAASEPHGVGGSGQWSSGESKAIAGRGTRTRARHLRASPRWSARPNLIEAAAGDGSAVRGNVRSSAAVRRSDIRATTNRPRACRSRSDTTDAASRYPVEWSSACTGSAPGRRPSPRRCDPARGLHKAVEPATFRFAGVESPRRECATRAPDAGRRASPDRAQPLERRRPVAEYDASASEQLSNRAASCAPTQVEDRGRFPLRCRDAAGISGRLRRVDAKHVGAEQREGAGRDRSGDHASEVEHADAGERPGRVGHPRLGCRRGRASIRRSGGRR